MNIIHYICGFIVLYTFTAQAAPTWKKPREGAHCLNHLIKVQEEYYTNNQITTGPRYFPRCSPDGKLWKSAQCDHLGVGSCFCVNVTNGQPLARFQNHDHQTATLEELDCKMQRSESGTVTCPEQQKIFKDMREEWDINDDIPLQYYPECGVDGKYMAMQRDDSRFFCVDVNTGDIIPDTETIPGVDKPISELLCASYSEVWNNFRDWKRSLVKDGLASGVTVPVDQNSCRSGFVFQSCGCPNVCTAGVKPNKSRCIDCKPVCACPHNLYNLNGKCISLEKCHQQKPASSVLHAEKLDILTNGMWRQYQENHPDEFAAIYERRMEESRNTIYTAPGVAHDHIVKNNEAPIEEEIPDEVPQQNTPKKQEIKVGPLGAEIISRSRMNRNEGGPPNPEEDEIDYKPDGQEEDGFVTPDPNEPVYTKPDGVDFGELYNYEVENANNGIDYYSEEYPLEEEEYVPEQGTEKTYEGSAEPTRSEEEFVGHQNPEYGMEEYPTLPVLSEEERLAIEEEFLAEPPCDEKLYQELANEGLIGADVAPTESEIAEEIYRVLEENAVIKPGESKELLAKFQTPEIVVKKSSLA